MALSGSKGPTHQDNHIARRTVKNNQVSFCIRLYSVHLFSQDDYV
ncbi:hypothetical protein BVRB_8g195780 [Beta vulgaris subsp. vulgaris]|nr:hypothetical protein BVRB_8g195780 [Beta vulgaris subsp. vulgaris]